MRIYLYSRFLKDFFIFKSLTKNDSRFQLEWRNRYPQVFDNTKKTNFDTHYVYHPAWAVRIIKKINPVVHVDISSTLSFSSMLSAFIPVQLYDYRPANLKLSGLISSRADLAKLDFHNESIASLSCMHAVEHIGLGRYGDPLDPNADMVAAKELARVLARGGNLLFVVPVGQPKIVFNAHRIYSYAQVLALFPELKLKEFSLIPDDALTRGMIENASEGETDIQKYGCGCFWFVKE